MPQQLSRPMTRTQRARLGAFIAKKRRTQYRTRRRTSPGLGASGPVGLPFTPARHGLTWAQCRLATWLLERANQRRPLTGARQQVQFRYALRIAGIVSSVKAGRVGNSAWGRAMLATRGGLAMAKHAPHILKANRERIQQQQAWDTHTAQQTQLDEQIEQWQQEQWQPKNFLAW
jgi:hypothetical protein